MDRINVNASGPRLSASMWVRLLMACALVVPLLPHSTVSQTVIASGGGTTSGGNYKVDWTIGQSVTGSGHNDITSFSLGYWSGRFGCTSSQPQIIGAPDTVKVQSGDTAVLTVTYSGTSIEFRWYKGDFALRDTGWFSGTTCNSLRIAHTMESDSGHFWVVATNCAGLADTSGQIWLDVEGVTGVDDGTEPNLPKVFALRSNYPNPFNPSTTIGFDLPRSCKVAIDIYNVLGQKIRTLVNDHRKAGRHSATWDGRADRGGEVSSGVYFYRIVAGDFAQTKKMLLLK